MTEASARRVAFAALKNWRTEGSFADRVISRLLDDSPLGSSDRAFAVELFYGVLRNLTWLDFCIGELRPRRVAADLRDVLRLGVYQLFFAKTPEHAAVFETVQLVPSRQRSIVNAILRSAIRARDPLQEKLESQPVHVRFSHPKFLIERWIRQFGDQATAELCKWNNQPPPIYLRINRLKIGRENFLARYPGARAISESSNFAEMPAPGEALKQGDCYIQDPSTVIACDLLEPKPGEKTLDACAAPGGKTCYLAELMRNQGRIVACDRDGERLRLVQHNLDALGVGIAQVVQHDWTTDLPTRILSEAPFDRILIDAPCSNTGVMRRRVDVRWRLNPGDFDRMQKRQVEIARAVLPLLRRDGILVYSTCSLEPEENQDVAKILVGQLNGLTLEEERRSLPFTDHFDGAFAARFRRTG